MALDQEQIYTEAQGIFRRGLVIVVGSGASSAFGLPSMGELAAHLIEAIPAKISARSLDCLPQWAPVSTSLQEGSGLEEALADGISPEPLAELISEQISVCIAKHEMSAINAILSDQDDPAFSKVFMHILRTCDRVDVVTTNYDRLLEVQAARVGLDVDTMFYGHTVGRFNPEQSRAQMLRPHKQVGKLKSTSFRSIPHIRLSKPHGSLDWFTYNGEHFRSDLALPGARSIVAPGGNKYRLGYDHPFDQQRERANSAIKSAAALLFVGYGFNDDHLQTHIKRRIREVPTLVLARTLTEKAKEYLSTNASAIGIEAHPSTDANSLATRGEEKVVLKTAIWNLDSLAKEVLAK